MARSLLWCCVYVHTGDLNERALALLADVPALIERVTALAEALHQVRALSVHLYTAFQSPAHSCVRVRVPLLTTRVTFASVLLLAAFSHSPSLFVILFLTEASQGQRTASCKARRLFI